jgi:hypothetical protein
LPANYTFTATDNGVHAFSATLKTAATQSLTATDTVTGSITGTQAGIVVTPAAAVTFVVTTDADDPDIAGTVFDVTVTATDPYGNTDTNYRGTVTFSSADPQAYLPADYTFKPGDAGSVTFFGQTALYTAGTQDVTATDTLNSAITGSAFVNVQAAPAVSFQVVVPDTATSGTPFDVTVIATDPYGNTDTNYLGTIHFTSTDPDPGVILPDDYTFTGDDQGMHTFTAEVTLITSGDQTLTVTDDVDSSITGSAVVTVNAPGPAPDKNSGPKPGTGIPLPTEWPKRVVVPAPSIEGTLVDSASRNLAQVDRLIMSAEAEGHSLASPNLRHKVLAQADEGFWIFFRNDRMLADTGFPTLPWD